MPKWYKEQKYVSTDDTFFAHYYKGDKVQGAKTCPAIQDITTYGFVIPLWSNLYFTTNEDQHIWEFPFCEAGEEPIESHISFHPSKQIDDLNLKKLMNGDLLKLKLPYWFKVPEGYNILFSDPFIILEMI